MRRVVVTGLGIVSSIGNNVDEVLVSLKEAKPGIVFAPEYAQLGFKCQVHGAPTLDPFEVLDRRTTRHFGYAMSQRKRPLIEKVFGWLKPVAGLKKVKLRGLSKVGWLFQFASAAYNLLRIPKLRMAAA